MQYILERERHIGFGRSILFLLDYALADRLHIGFLLHPSRGECTRVGREPERAEEEDGSWPEFRRGTATAA